MATPLIPSWQDRQKQPKSCSCSSFNPYQMFAECSLTANSKEFLIFSTWSPFSDRVWKRPPCSVPTTVRRKRLCHSLRARCPASRSPQLWAKPKHCSLQLRMSCELLTATSVDKCRSGCSTQVARFRWSANRIVSGQTEKWPFALPLNYSDQPPPSTVEQLKFTLTSSCLPRNPMPCILHQKQTLWGAERCSAAAAWALLSTCLTWHVAQQRLGLLLVHPGLELWAGEHQLVPPLPTLGPAAVFTPSSCCSQASTIPQALREPGELSHLEMAVPRCFLMQGFVSAIWPNNLHYWQHCYKLHISKTALTGKPGHW